MECDGPPRGWGKPDALAEWEIFLLTIAVFPESQSGELPDEWITAMSWVFLNRVSLGTHESLFDAINGQSAFDVYARANFPMLPGEEPAAYAERFRKEYSKYAENIDSWNDVYELVTGAYLDWQKYGTGSNADPTNGATGFLMKAPESHLEEHKAEWCAKDPQCSGASRAEQATKMAEYVKYNSVEYALSTMYPSREDVPGYTWGYLGPASASSLDAPRWLFWDNKLDPAVSPYFTK